MIAHVRQVPNEQLAASIAFAMTFPAQTALYLPTEIYQPIGQRYGTLNKVFLFAMTLPCFEMMLHR
jgi:hypothetical protein